MNMTDTLSQVRTQATEIIKNALKSNNIDSLDLVDMEPTDIPIVQDDLEDEENIFTLDSIELYGGKLLFNASSSYDCRTFPAESVDIELLVYIAEWTEQYADAIKEYLGECE